MSPYRAEQAILQPLGRWHEQRIYPQMLTAKRKVGVVMDIFKGKTSVAEVARHHDLTELT